MAIPSTPDLHLVTLAITRFQALLQHAGTLKPETTVEPPLPSAELDEDLDSLHDIFDEHHDQTYRYFTLETAARRTLYSLIRSEDIDTPGFVSVWNLLDLVLLCGDRGKCTPELICWLTEELLDSQTTDGCRKVFDYLESRRERLARKDFHKKNLVFLRSCNELLRRLSRAEDAIFCGRVFFFLFQTFPLGDKSSVNLRGEFHVENVTRFDTIEHGNGAESSDIDKMYVDLPTTGRNTPVPAPTPKAGSKAVSIKPPSKKLQQEQALPDNQLYPIFWSLQHCFSDPSRLLNASEFGSFKKGLASTLLKFKKTSTVVQTRVGTGHGIKRKQDDLENDDETASDLIDAYNPKYLTSRDLFHLELSDLAFQRHILVQALIIVDFLLSLGDKAKKKLADLTTPNKSLLYPFTLSDEDKTWADATKQDISEYLAMTAEGRQYFRMVETVLARDKNWVRWKIESCPSIVRGPVSTEEEMAARKGARDATRPRRIPDRPMNAMNFSFLDEASGDGLEALRKPSRYTSSTIEQLVECIKTDEMDKEMAMDEAETQSLEAAIANKKWRALRRARVVDLSLLDRVDASMDLEIAALLVKTAAERRDGADAVEQDAAENGEVGTPVEGAAAAATAVTGSTEDATGEHTAASTAVTTTHIA